MTKKTQDDPNPSLEALKGAKEKAEAANRAKSELLGIVSHELRLPLTSIVGMAHMLQLEYLLPVQRDQVEEILKAGEHLVSLVDDLLDIAQLETGKVELNLAPLDLKKLLDETAAMLAFQTKLNGLELLINYDETVPQQVISDARALRQIILNLVGNALKFTERGYIVIQVKCLAQTTTHAQLVLSIEDTGVGIAQDKLQAIFASFQQDDIDYQRRYKGAGLGLTISKAYTELMGGEMTVQSEFGKGSIFSCIIPFQLQTAITEQKEIVVPAIAIKKNMRILLVEDDCIIQTVHKRMLEQAGCKVDVAEDGPVALALFDHGYDLIFMDVGLPRMSGIEVVEEIRKRENGTHHTPIIALTGFTQEEDKNNCLAAGMDAVATKPITLEALKNLLAQWGAK